MTDNADGFTLRKRLGMGMALPEGDFGVQSLASEEGNVKGDSLLPDHKRAAKPPINGNQANPDHGFK